MSRSKRRKKRRYQPFRELSVPREASCVARTAVAAVAGYDTKRERGPVVGPAPAGHDVARRLEGRRDVAKRAEREVAR